MKLVYSREQRCKVKIVVFCQMILWRRKKWQKLSLKIEKSDFWQQKSNRGAFYEGTSQIFAYTFQLFSKNYQELQGCNKLSKKHISNKIIISLYVWVLQVMIDIRDLLNGCISYIVRYEQLYFQHIKQFGSSVTNRVSFYFSFA